MKYLIVGIGNVGSQYELTRHNIGFRILDSLSEKLESRFELDKSAFYSEVKYKGKSLNLIKPSNYVNNSGKSVNYWSKLLKVKEENILVVLDDISIPFGQIRIKKKGSDGGHNGLKSINEYLNTTNYPRLKFGIDNNFRPGQQSNYVLDSFSKEESKVIDIEIERATEIILSFCHIGIDRTMNKYN